jgi:hypothetical protein
MRSIEKTAKQHRMTPINSHMPYMPPVERMSAEQCGQMAVNCIPEHPRLPIPRLKPHAACIVS